MINDKVIQVCDKCLRACCWYGMFMCDDSRTAGTVYKTVRELKALNAEHSDYWTDKQLIHIYGEVPGYTWPARKEAQNADA